MPLRLSRLKWLLIPLGLLVLFCGWWFIASDYDYDRLAGTYVYRDAKVNATLLLRADQSFHMELIEGGQSKLADGKWRRIGEGGVNFSAGFLRVPGAKTFIEDHGTGYGDPADNQFYGEFFKILTIYPELRIDPRNTGPVLHRKLF